VIRGIGIDLVSIPRVTGVWARHGERFARRILSVEEWPEFAAASQPDRLLAKRFAAKEAFAKAIGTGIRSPFRWHSVTVTRDPRGAPALAPSPDMARYLAERGVTASHISLTDDAGIAVAFVVLEG
jgi:holo-[acyl-carrier protein] synthase